MIFQFCLFPGQVCTYSLVLKIYFWYIFLIHRYKTSSKTHNQDPDNNSDMYKEHMEILST